MTARFNPFNWKIPCERNFKATSEAESPLDRQAPDQVSHFDNDSWFAIDQVLHKRTLVLSHFKSKTKIVHQENQNVLKNGNGAIVDDPTQ